MDVKYKLDLMKERFVHELYGSKNRVAIVIQATTMALLRLRGPQFFFIWLAAL